MNSYGYLGNSSSVTASAIADQFEKVARERSDMVAVRTLADGGSLTFGELAADCATLRQALVDLGVGRGAVVVSSVGSHPVFFAVVVACMDLGAALLPLGDATDTEAAALVHRIGATAIITDRTISVPVADERTLGSGMRLLKLPERGDSRSYGEAVVLKLTSGSTDLPKAAVASEWHLINDGRHIVDAMGIGPADVNLSCIPLSHSYAIGNIVMPLLWQGTGVALRPLFSPSQFVQDVTESGATVFPAVPFVFERMKSIESLERLPPSFRLLITAGARIDLATVLWFKERLGQKIHSFYGSSETGGISYDDSEAVTDPLNVGRALPRNDGDGPSFRAWRRKGSDLRHRKRGRRSIAPKEEDKLDSDVLRRWLPHR